MSAPISPVVEASSRQDLCEIEATVTSGFEVVALQDAVEKLGCKVVRGRGRIFIHIPVKQAEKVLQLGGVDNLYVVVKRYEDFNFSKDQEEVMKQIKGIVPEVNWELGLHVWSKFIKFAHQVSPHPIDPSACQSQISIQKQQPVSQPKVIIQQKNGDKDCLNSKQNSNVTEVAPHSGDCFFSSKQDDAVHSDTDHSVMGKPTSQCSILTTRLKQALRTTPLDNSDEPAAKKKRTFNPNLPKFRATCYRTGNNHSFQSMEAASQFGGTIQDYFGWNVDLKNHDLEVVLNIADNDVYVTLGLTTESLHKRNIVDFGPTTLRTTIAYNMLRLSHILPGDVVCDPMCGGGSISIEGAVNWPNAYHICGDNHEKAWPRCQQNLDFVREKRRMKGRSSATCDVMKWDVTNLPLRDNTVDVFITDLPFGKRLGSTMDNRVLYPKALTEMARVCKPKTGRACLLTHDRRSIAKAMQAVSHLWHRGIVLWINIGGLAAGVYMLHRNADDGKKERKEARGGQNSAAGQ
ncbi:THUMP domain-containing protein 3 [Lingula anatina]|uniref:THUMP domain-containing protein 3 n=1 Tax=Lingula anatina TaxID=7574 RepID=A0A1S3GXX3_LINAN|nr:THUMP domain-containing protein 3 [Lingula anatina]|eukprot:XP_013378720.1 THUMP domain-containing protein 3 [Lingula anatina]